MIVIFMLTSTKKYIKTVLTSLFCMCSFSVAFAQSISRPNVTDACFVNPDEPQNINAIISGGVIPNGTEFVLRLSNKSGGFNTNSIIIAQTQNAGNNIVFTNFSYPTTDGEGTTLGSDEYRLRVEQSIGDLQSPRSNEFSAYFYDGTLLQLDPRVLCEFGQLRAIPDNLTEYVWHRITNTGGDQIIPGESSSTLNANVEGQYYFTPQLGNCGGFIPEARSNFVTVFEAQATNVPDFTIAITAGSTPFCADEGSITLSSSFVDSSFSYQWIRNDMALSGETSPTLTVSDIDSEGMYLLEISDDSRRSSERCATQSQNQIFVDLNNPFINFAPEQPLVVPDVPGETEFLEVEVTGEAPLTITWFRDNVEIPNSNTARIESLGPGNYTATVSGSSCSTFNQDTTGDTPIEVVAINNLDIVINYDNPNYTTCGLSQIGIVIESITTQVNGDLLNLSPNTFQNEEITWFNNNEELAQFIGPNIAIDDAGGNGMYTVEITVGAINFTSNTLEVQLNPGELSIEATETILTDDNPISELSVPLTSEAIPSLFTYRWFKENAQAPNGQEQISTSSTVQVNTPGNYFVEVTFDTCPPVRLNTVFISAASVVIPNILTPNGFNNTNWELPAQYTNQPNVTVQIISSSGQEVLNQNNYNGTWPDQELSESIYYYIISENNNPVEQGSITIIR